jgi:hypothetical protein
LLHRSVFTRQKQRNGLSPSGAPFSTEWVWCAHPCARARMMMIATAAQQRATPHPIDLDSPLSPHSARRIHADANKVTNNATALAANAHFMSLKRQATCPAPFNVMQRVT